MTRIDIAESLFAVALLALAAALFLSANVFAPQNFGTTPDTAALSAYQGSR